MTTPPTGTLTPDVPRNTILCGDALMTLHTLPDGCIQTCVTSPPYFGLRSYGTEPAVWGGVSTCNHRWEVQPPRKSNQVPQTNINGKGSKIATLAPGHEPMGDVCIRCDGWRGELGQEPTIALYIEHLIQVFREVGRVMRADASLWVNLGDGYSNNTKWGGGSHPVKNTTSRDGGYTGQKVKRETGFPPKSLMLIPMRFAIAMQDEGWVLRNAIVWEKPNALCESVTDRCTMNYEYIFLFSKGSRYYFDAEAIKEPVTGGAHRKGKGVHPKSAEPGSGIRANTSWEAVVTELVDSRNARSVWNIPTKPFPGAHFATFPPELAERCIAAGSSPQACEQCGAPFKRRVIKKTRYAGGSAKAGRTPDEINAMGKWAGHLQGNKHLKSGPINSPTTTGWTPTCKCNGIMGSGRCLALDPFMGAGTVGMAAQRLGRDYLGVELNPTYVAMAKDRIIRDTLPEAMRDVDLALLPPSLFADLEVA